MADPMESGSASLSHSAVDLTFSNVMANDIAVSNFLGQISLPFLYTSFHLLLTLNTFNLLEFLTSINEQSLFSLYLNCVVSILNGRNECSLSQRI